MGVTGPSQANGTFVIGQQLLNANQFSLNGTANATTWAAYSGGGSWATNNEETLIVHFDTTNKVYYPPAYLSALSHPTGVSVICRGNPGPWMFPNNHGYTVRNDPQVVPYFAIID
jgi:hypothetical protein